MAGDLKQLTDRELRWEVLLMLVESQILLLSDVVTEDDGEQQERHSVSEVKAKLLKVREALEDRVECLEEERKIGETL